MNLTQKELNKMIRTAIKVFYQTEHENEIREFKMRFYKRHYKKDSTGKITRAVRGIARKMDITLSREPWIWSTEIWFYLRGRRKSERPFRKAVKLAISKYKI